MLKETDNGPLRRAFSFGEAPSAKTCRCCHVEKPDTEFARAGDKRRTICKPCDAVRQRKRHAEHGPEINKRKREKRVADPEHFRRQRRESYERNIETERQRARDYAKTERGRAANRRAVAAYAKAHPERVRAHIAAREAERKGLIARPSVCQVRGCCETKGLHRHHFRGYDDANVLAVVHCCAPHHRELHHSRSTLPLKKSASAALSVKFARAPRLAKAA